MLALAQAEAVLIIQTAELNISVVVMAVVGPIILPIVIASKLTARVVPDTTSRAELLLDAKNLVVIGFRHGSIKATQIDLLVWLQTINGP